MTTNTTAACGADDLYSAQIIRAWCASCGMPEPSNGECLALTVALSTAAAQPPAGWVMVPVEPTPEMVTAVYNSVRPGTMLEIAHTVWRAMLEAAPKVPPMSWNAGNAGTTPGDFSEEIAAQPPMSNELGELIGSFDAAMAEGLYEALAETTDERLRDLVERRLLAGYQIAVGPSLATAPTTQPAAQQGPVAWLHDDPKRFDVIHAEVKDLLVKSRDAAGYLHRPLDKSEHYTIPLYAQPQEAARQGDNCNV